MPNRKHRPKTKRVKLPTAKELNEQLAWATRIIKMQQDEVDRLMKQVDKLTDALSQVSRRCD